MPITSDDIRRGGEWLEKNKRSFANAVDYREGRFVLEMKGHKEHHPVRKVIPAVSIPPLRDRSDKDLQDVELTPMGDTLHFKSINVDVYIPAVLKFAL